jgi:hypothetical protein
MENYKKKSGNSQSYDIITKINCDDKLLSKTKDIANAFNKFYAQIVKNANTKHGDMYKASLLLRNIKLDNTVQMETILVSVVEVKTTIKSLKSKNSTGYDGISNKIPKYCIHTISKPLIFIYIYIYIKSLIDDWNFPRKVQIFNSVTYLQKRRKKEISNYRPISLLIGMSKISETPDSVCQILRTCFISES